MAKCGIEKYDELPGRVALIDVDHARASLNRIREADSQLELFFAGLERGGAIHGLLGNQRKMEERIFSDLENARKIYDEGPVDNIVTWVIRKVPGMAVVPDKKSKNDTMGDNQSN